jgi:hypothetical protein
MANHIEEKIRQFGSKLDELQIEMLNFVDNESIDSKISSELNSAIDLIGKATSHIKNALAFIEKEKEEISFEKRIGEAIKFAIIGFVMPDIEKIVNRMVNKNE